MPEAVKEGEPCLLVRVLARLREDVDGLPAAVDRRRLLLGLVQFADCRGTAVLLVHTHTGILSHVVSSGKPTEWWAIRHSNTHSLGNKG